MARPGLGHKSFLQIGMEAANAYGTPVAATHRIEIISSSIVPVIGAIRDPSLNDQRSRRGVYPGGRLYKGTVKTRMNYSGLEILWDALFGTLAVGDYGLEEPTPAGDLYTYTFIEQEEINSYSLQLGQGDIPTGKCQILAGAMCTGVTIRGAAGQGDDAMLQAEWTFVGKTLLSDQAYTAGLDAMLVEPVLYHHATTVDDGVTAAAVNVKSFEAGMSQPFHEDRFYLGSLVPDQPLPSDFLTCSFKFTREFTDITLLAAAAAGTPGSPELVFTDPVVTGQKLTMRISEGQITEYGNPVEGYGIINQTIGWEGSRSDVNADDTAFAVVVVSEAIFGNAA